MTTTVDIEPAQDSSNTTITEQDRTSNKTLTKQDSSNETLTKQDSSNETPLDSVSTQTPPTTSIEPLPELQTAYQELYAECREHAEYFRDDVTERGQRLSAALTAWQDFICRADTLTRQVQTFAHKYDFDENTPGNGYRSFVTVTNSCIAYGLEICKNLKAARGTMFFRKKFYMKEVEACSQLLSSLCTCLQYVLILHDWSSDSGDLFANGDHSAEELFEMGDTINQYCFYGRCLGFQYSESIRGIVRFISIGMAGFSETFYAEEADGPLVKTTRSVWTSGKYFLNPELRARRIVNISQNSNIDFCKSFWFLAESELMHMIPSIVGSSIKVNRMIEIPAEPLQLPRLHRKQDKALITDENQNAPLSPDEMVDIPVATSHLGPGLPVSVRLLSYTRREGMLGEGGGLYRGWRRVPPRSPSILFHCHGGGFVAQSSKSHELYLRDWAVALDVPILSVDYSLAPEAPFPRALEEVFYAYCWMLRNASHLGTTAERIVVAGDSAGANLCIGVALKCIERGIRRPDGVFLAYCPTLISFVPSPARLLCLMDPVLPFGFMMRCLQAYASPATDTLKDNARHAEELADVRNAAQAAHHYTLHLERGNGVEGAIENHSHTNGGGSVSSSRRTSAAKSPISSVAENSKWDQIKLKSRSVDGETVDPPEEAKAAEEDSSSDTFASASYHSQTVERTDLPSGDDDDEDNSLCVSFEDDSQPIVHYPIEISAAAALPPNSDSEHYIDRFLDQYLIDTNIEEAKESATALNGGLITTMAKTASEENLLLDTGKELIALDSIQGRFNNAVNTISSTLSRYTQSNEIRHGSPQHATHVPRTLQNLRNMDALIARSPSVEFDFQVPRDPFLSPYWACDEWLSQMPSTKILTLDMDPCLDDCVMFARKLKKLGRPVSLDILSGLPHGFLNFTMLSHEAMEGSKRCIKCLKELLALPPPEDEPTKMATPMENQTNRVDNAVIVAEN